MNRLLSCSEFGLVGLNRIGNATLKLVPSFRLVYRSKGLKFVSICDADVLKVRLQMQLVGQRGPLTGMVLSLASLITCILAPMYRSRLIMRLLYRDDCFSKFLRMKDQDFCIWD